MGLLARALAIMTKDYCRVEVSPLQLLARMKSAVLRQILTESPSLRAALEALTAGIRPMSIPIPIVIRM